MDAVGLVQTYRPSEDRLEMDMPEQSGHGFGALPRERRRQIASQGGRAAHKKGTAHEFTPEEARQAGRKGGEAVSKDRAHMSQIGRKGGERSRSSRGAAGRLVRNQSADGAPGRNHRQPATSRTEAGAQVATAAW